MYIKCSLRTQWDGGNKNSGQDVVALFTLVFVQHKRKKSNNNYVMYYCQGGKRELLSIIPAEEAFSRISRIITPNRVYSGRYIVLIM